MQLLDLPLELVRLMVEKMVESAGLYKATRLRLVCALFKKSVDEVLHTYLYRDLCLEEYPRLHFMSRSTLAKHLMGSFRGRQPRTAMSDLIGRTVTFLDSCRIEMEDGEIQTDVERHYSLSMGLWEALARHKLRVDEVVSLAVAKELLDFDPQEERRAALVAVATTGDVLTLKNLVANYPNVTAHSKHFGSALNAAAASNQLEVVEFFLEGAKNSDILATELRVVGYAACSAGHTQIAEMLFNIWETNDDKWEMCINSALKGGHGALAALLINHVGIETWPDSRKERTFLLAAASGCEEVVRVMMDAGVSMYTLGSYVNVGRTAFEKAALKGRRSVVELFLARGFDRSNQRFGNALIMTAYNGHEGIAQLLIDAGADVNFRGHYVGPASDGPHPGFSLNGTAISAAARNDEVSMMQFLLDKGADVNAHGKGAVALKLACQRGYDMSVRRLIEAGVDPDGSQLDKRRGDSPMLSAIKTGQDRVVRTLLEMGAKKVGRH